MSSFSNEQKTNPAPGRCGCSAEPHQCLPCNVTRPQILKTEKKNQFISPAVLWLFLIISANWVTSSPHSSYTDASWLTHPDFIFSQHMPSPPHPSHPPSSEPETSVSLAFSFFSHVMCTWNGLSWSLRGVKEGKEKQWRTRGESWKRKQRTTHSLNVTLSFLPQKQLPPPPSSSTAPPLPPPSSHTDTQSLPTKQCVGLAAV